MQVAVLTNRGFVMREERQPECGPGQVLVKAAACGICTGDVERYRMAQGEAPVETVLGHEGSGYVAAVGPGVEGFKEGDAVTALGGPYADYFLADAQSLVQLPENVPPTWGLGEPVACVVHAGGRFGIELGDRVAVLGCGFMGLLCLQVALLRGAGHVCAVDLMPWRLETAQQFGADSTYRLSSDGIEGVAEKLGEFDVVLEVAGSASAVTLAGQLVREHGRILLIGYHLSGGGMRTVNMERWNYKAVDVINGHVRRDDEKLRAMRAAINLLASGRLRMEPLVSSYPLGEANRAFEELVDRKPGLLKATLVPEG